MTENWLTDVTSWVATNPGWLNGALFLTALIESLAIAGIIVPGVALLFTFAALAGKSGLPLADALLWAGLGAVAGDAISFAIGRLLKGRLNTLWPFSRYPASLPVVNHSFTPTEAKAWSSAVRWPDPSCHSLDCRSPDHVLATLSHIQPFIGRGMGPCLYSARFLSRFGPGQ